MSRSTPRGSAVPVVVLIIVLGFFALLIAIYVLAFNRTNSVRADWEETLGSFDEIMQRFPATEANGTALDLERRAAVLGVRLSPRHIERSLPDPKVKQAFGRMKKMTFNPYAFKQAERVHRSQIDAPPAALVEYMDAYASELEALRDLLIQGEIPVWESDMSRLYAAPIPNLLGQIDLHKLLISAALVKIRSGDTPGALQFIEASWYLSCSLRDSPILINQLIYISATRLQTGALRHVRDLPQDWIKRVEEHDFRDSFVTAMQFEAWLWMHFDRTSSDDTSTIPLWRKLPALVVRPYTRLCMADISDTLRKRLDKLEQLTTLCDRDLSEVGADLDIVASRWNTFGGLMMPQLTDAVHRVARLELDLELLLLASEADAARRSDAAWPGPDAADRPSIACQGDRWTYTATAEGLKIALSRDVDWPQQMGAVLPQSIVLD